MAVCHRIEHQVCNKIGYYLFVCMIYVILIFFSLYGSLLLYSIEIYIVDYDIYHCLLHMIYVLGLAIYSKLCRGVYAVMLFTPLHIFVINFHDPDLILIVYMLSVTGRLATLK